MCLCVLVCFLYVCVCVCLCLWVPVFWLVCGLCVPIICVLVFVCCSAAMQNGHTQEHIGWLICSGCVSQLLQLLRWFIQPVVISQTIGSVVQTHFRCISGVRSGDKIMISFPLRKLYRFDIRICLSLMSSCGGSWEVMRWHRCSSSSWCIWGRFMMQLCCTCCW